VFAAKFYCAPPKQNGFGSVLQPQRRKVNGKLRGSIGVSGEKESHLVFPVLMQLLAEKYFWDVWTPHFK